MRVVIAAVQHLFTTGGAELHVKSLRDALLRRGHETEVVQLPFRWTPNLEALRQAYQWRLIDLGATGADLVITTKFPSFYVRAPRKVAWVLHQHRAVYDGFDDPAHSSYSSRDPDDAAVRDAIRRWDTKYLAESEALFANSRTVADRLRRWNGLEARALYHPPPSAEELRPGPFGDYVFLPTRIEVNKRPWLLAEALALARSPVRAVIAGKGPQEDRLREAARRLGVADRIDLRGWVSDEERIRLHAGALAVFYPPFDEDLGYVTLEGFLSAKPVITMADSGGPTEFVRTGANGFVAADPAEAAAALDAYFEDRGLAEKHGREGLATYRRAIPDWDTVCRTLLGET